MKHGGFVAALLLLVTCFARAETVKESRLDVARYGLTKVNCPWNPGRVEFLDDDHLVISAPLITKCENSGDAADTQITVIDLEGNRVAGIHRTDVEGIAAGPIGFVKVCTADRIELLSRELQVAASMVASTQKSQRNNCSFVNKYLSPSRTALAVAGPAESQLRLFQGPLTQQIAEIQTLTRQNVWAVADDGILVCDRANRRCDVTDPTGAVRSFASPAFAHYIVGFLTPDKLLIGDYNGKRLYAEKATGDQITIADVAKIRPPFVTTSGAEISAAEPRRILYDVEGCLLTDFVHCYGVMFHRFAVFDSRTSKMLFHHTYAAEAELRMSPNGHLVMERDGTTIHLFMLP